MVQKGCFNLSDVVFNQILSTIISNSNMDKKEIIRKINRNQAKHCGTLPEVEALLIAKGLGIEINNFISKVEDRIIHKSKRGRY